MHHGWAIQLLFKELEQGNSQECYWIFSRFLLFGLCQGITVKPKPWDKRAPDLGLQLWGCCSASCRSLPRGSWPPPHPIHHLREASARHLSFTAGKVKNLPWAQNVSLPKGAVPSRTGEGGQHAQWARRAGTSRVCLTGHGHSPADQRGVWDLGFGVWGLLLWPCGSSLLSSSRTGQQGLAATGLAPGEGRARHPPLLRLAAAHGVHCSSWPEQQDGHGTGFLASLIAEKLHGKCSVAKLEFLTRA